MSDIVAFRRINGRIIPIRRAKGRASKDHNTAKGLGIVGAGVSVAAATGLASAKMIFKAARTENAARTALQASRGFKKTAEAAGPLFKAAAEEMHEHVVHKALKTMAESRHTFAAAQNIRKWGRGAGAALIGIGVHNLLKDTKLKDDKKTAATIAVGSAAAAHFVIKTAFLRGFKHPLFAAAKTAAKSTIIKGFK